MRFLGVWGEPYYVAWSKESAQQGEMAIERKLRKLAQNKHNKELEISDCFETNLTHPCTSLECGDHHGTWPRQKKVHNKVKWP